MTFAADQPDARREGPARRRALLLINPNARRGAMALDDILARLTKGGLDVTVEPFSALPELARDIVRLRDRTDCIVICGGDGTVSSGAMAVMESGLPMGILPLGTANDLARTLGIPPDLDAAADLIIGGYERRIDLGSVNGHAFFNVASIGLSTELAKGLRPELKRRWGRLGYAIAALRTLARARPFTAWITENDRSVKVKTFQVAVGNGRHYGGGNVVEASAAIDDGHLDLYSLEMRTVWTLALMLHSFRAGTHGAWSEVRTARGTQFEVRTRRPQPVNTDGEIVTATPATFRVHPEAIAVYAPPGTDDA